MDKPNEELNPVELIGKVVREPELVSTDKGDVCLFQIEWEDGFDAGYDIFEIIIIKGWKPWKLKKGDIVLAVGCLEGNRLFAEACTKLKLGRLRRWT